MPVSARAPRGLIGFVALVAVLMGPGLLMAKVEQATLYPRGASIQERVQLEKERSRIELILPGEARKETLRVRAGEGDVQSVSLSRDERLADPKAIAELKRRIEELEGKQAETGNDLRRVGKLVAFYEGKVSAETKGAKATAEMAKLLDESLEGLYAERRTFREKRSQIQTELRKVRKRLKELTGAKDSIWRVHVQTEEALPKGSHLEYSYYLDSASWTPKYSVNALPEKDRADLVWRAQVVQRSGSDWRDVALRVATATRRFRPDPPQVREWVIRPARSDKASRAHKALSADGTAPKRAEAAQAPKRDRDYSGDVYELGRVDFPAGEEQRLILRRIGLPARFIHLVRPLETPECFIRAELRSKERMRLPRGEAALELEGTYVGRSAFSMRGKEATVSFGADRDVAAEVTRLTKKGGKQGFFQGEKTYQWGWRFKIANTRDQAIRLRLELPWPRLRSEAIELEPLHDFSEEDVQEHRAVKELDVAASSNATVEYGVRIVYPKDMELDLGRF